MFRPLLSATFLWCVPLLAFAQQTGTTTSGDQTAPVKLPEAGPANEQFANVILTKNIFDNETSSLILNDEEIKAIREGLSALSPNKPEDRIKAVESLIKIVGKDRARKVGLIFHDEQGRSVYVWPSPDAKPGPAEVATQFRTWTAGDGRKAEMAFVSASGDKVTVKRKDGKVFTISLKSLSEQDQDWVKEQNLAPHKLSKTESQKFPANSLNANVILFNNPQDSETGKYLLTDDEVQSMRTVIRGCDASKTSDRNRLVNQAIEIIGDERARQMGLVFYDDKGRAEYVWPALSP